jgi:hypothetical protein
MTNLSKELIKKLKRNTDFQVFQEYIIEQIQLLDTLDGVDDSNDNKSLGEMVRARIEAKRVLYGMLRPFIEHQEKKEPTQEEIEEAKKKVGL